MQGAQMRTVRTMIDEQSMAHEFAFVNGGQRGLQVRLNPGDAVKLLNAMVAPLAHRQASRRGTCHIAGPATRDSAGYQDLVLAGRRV
jgi:hypothetical protein